MQSPLRRLEVRGGTASHHREHRRDCALSQSKDGTSREDVDMLLHGSRKDWRQDTNGTAKSDRQGEHGHPFRVKRPWVSLPINGDAHCNKWRRSSSVYGGAFERLACQCESPHLTAIHVNPGLGCAPASTRSIAVAPWRQLSIRHTTVSGWKGAPEVWILLTACDDRRFRLKQKGWLVRKKRSPQ